MASSNSTGPRYVRRFVWLALVIVLVGVGYAYAWNYVADRVLRETRTAVERLNRDGRRANCENAEVRGFPFRIGVFCRSVLYEDARAGVGVRAQEFRSAAQVYNPWRIVAELDGPALIEIPGLNALAVDWGELRASARVAQPLPERVSVEASQVTADLESDPAQTGGLIRLDAGEFHMRPVDDSLDVALRFSGLTADSDVTGGRALPPLAGLADIVLDGLANGPQPGMTLRGLSGTLRNVSLTMPQDAGATIAGPFSIGEDGLIDAQLQITLRNPSALSATLTEVFPEAASQISSAFSGLAMLGNEPALPLVITDGRARIGFLPLGDIPPVE